MVGIVLGALMIIGFVRAGFGVVLHIPLPIIGICLLLMTGFKFCAIEGMDNIRSEFQNLAEELRVVLDRENERYSDMSFHLREEVTNRKNKIYFIECVVASSTPTAIPMGGDTIGTTGMSSSLNTDTAGRKTVAA